MKEMTQKVKQTIAETSDNRAIQVALLLVVDMRSEPLCCKTPVLVKYFNKN